MTRKWSARSKAVYDELCPELQDVCTYILTRIDVSLVKGHRPKDEQDAAFDAGFSKVRWPDGKHNTLPSDAVDLQPYPYPESDLKLWAALGYIAGTAVEYGRSKGYQLRWGGDWNQNGDLTDQNFDDLFHLEVIRD